MTQEDKNLLLKDLCARLPYGVMLKHISTEKPFNLFSFKRDEYVSYKEDGVELAVDGIYYDWVVNNIYHNIGSYIKPYLRPISSMTKDEKEELVDFGLAYWDNGKHTDEDGNTIIYGGKNFQLLPDIETYDWLNKNHFDYRGLIPKDLAIEVTEENNPYK